MDAMAKIQVIRCSLSGSARASQARKGEFYRDTSLNCYELQELQENLTPYHIMSAFKENQHPIYQQTHPKLICRQ